MTLHGLTTKIHATEYRKMSRCKRLIEVAFY